MVSATQVVVVLATVGALAFIWYARGRGRWLHRFDDRLVYGVPWGTAVTVSLVVGFYLLAQGGLNNWEDPLTIPYRTWSAFYPVGLLTAGVAHGSPSHLLGNMTATLALAPLVEYAWGHYPRRDGDDEGPATGSLLDRPWIRALVAFPLALLGVAFVSSVLPLGFGLGFSGAVFALAGFAVVNYPVWTVVALFASRAFGVLFSALTEPVVRESIARGPPRPPAWAGIGFQAHMIGFLIGVVVGGLLVARRDRQPSIERVFFGTALLGLGQALWLVVGTGGDDVFVLYRGIGVTVFVLLTVLVSVAIAGSDRPLPRPLSVLPWAPTRRQLAIGWLGLLGAILAVGIAASVTVDTEASPVAVVGILTVVVVLLALPALGPLVPDRVYAGPASLRTVAVALLVVLTLVVGGGTVPFKLLLVDDPGPVDGGVTVEDYTVTYAENGSFDRSLVGFGDPFSSTLSGVVVVNDDREILSVPVQPETLAYSGSETVVVGGIGWRESVTVNRTGWDVVGNGTVYAVDLRVDGDSTRSFQSDPRRANVRVDGRTVDVVPTADGYSLRVTENGRAIGTAPVPDVEDSVTVGDLQFRTERDGAVTRIVAETGDTSVQVAERETYPGQ